jgi:MFS family permease
MITTQEYAQNTLVHRSPVYYGWVVWVVATIGMLATSPGQSYTVSLFIDHFIHDFGLGRTTVAGLYSLGTFVAALGLTWVGRKIDRYGNRRSALVIGTLFALGLVAWSMVTGPLGLLVGFIAIRGLGQGSLSLVSSTAIAQWFRSRRGFMMSLTMIAFSVFQGFYVPWLQGMLERHTWQQVWVILGVLVALAVLPLTWLLMRDRPEDFGLEPDGRSHPPAQTTPAQEDNWTLREALRTSIFWIFILARLLPPAWTTGLVLHQISLFGGLGYEPGVAAEVFGGMAILTALVALGAGFVVDRLNPARFIALQMLALALTLYLALVMVQPWMLTLYALGMALVLGGGPVFDGTVWPNLFGRQHQGAIRGFVTSGMVVGSAIGPVLFGLSYDVLGGYEPILWVGIGLCLTAVVASFFARKPYRNTRGVITQ